MINSGRGFYQIYVNDNLWLESGQLEAFMNHQWYTTNSEKSKVSKELKLSQSNVVEFEEIKLLSVNSYNDLSDDFGGKYSSIDYEWITDDVFSTVFHTIFKVYENGESISFGQYFPNGVSDTNFVNESKIPPTCEGDSRPNPILSFPSFSSVGTNDSESESDAYTNGDLGWLTWRNTFSTASYGKGVISDDGLAGVNGGPIVLYDQVIYCIYIWLIFYFFNFPTFF